MTRFLEEEKKMKETIIDLQVHSISGIPEQAGEDTEGMVKNFIQKQLKHPPDTVKNKGVSFSCF